METKICGKCIEVSKEYDPFSELKIYTAEFEVPENSGDLFCDWFKTVDKGASLFSVHRQYGKDCDRVYIASYYGFDREYEVDSYFEISFDQFFAAFIELQCYTANARIRAMTSRAVANLPGLEL